MMSIHSWASQLWTSTWQGVAFIAVVWLVCKYGKGLSSGVRYWLWWLACAKLLIGLVPIHPISVPLLSPSASVTRPLASNLERVEPPTYVTDTPMAPQPGSAPEQGFDPVVLVAIVWGLGVLVRLSIGIRGGLRIRQVLRRAQSVNETGLAGLARQLGVQLGVSRSPRVAESGEITSPLVAGMFHPTIVLPRGFGSALSPEELSLALAHELAHIRRKDLVHGIVPMVAEILFFVLPPAWLACSEWVTEREAACDEEALRQTGAPAAAYGHLLIRLVSLDSHALPAAIGVTAGYQTLKRRLTMIKSFGTSHRTFRWGSGAVALAAILVAPWAVTAQPPPDPQNLLRNSSLEQNSDGWVQGTALDGVSYLRPDKVSHTGSGSLCIIKTEPKFFPVAQWSQPFHYDGKAKHLKVEAWVKAKQATKAIIDVQFLRDAGNGTKENISHAWAAYMGPAEEGGDPVDFDWKLCSGTVAIPEGTQDIVIALQQYGPGSVWFDDITADYSETPGEPLKLPAAPEWSGGPNVVSNGGFEDGLAGWNFGSLPEGVDVPGVTITPDGDTKHGGSQSMLFSKTANAYFPVRTFLQNLPFEKGKYKKVRVSLWMKAENATKVTVPIHLESSGGDGDKVWVFYEGVANDGDKPANHDWKQFVRILNIPASIDSVSIGFEVYGPGKLWADDLEVSFK